MSKSKADEFMKEVRRAAKANGVEASEINMTLKTPEGLVVLQSGHKAEVLQPPRRR